MCVRQIRLDPDSPLEVVTSLGEMALSKQGCTEILVDKGLENLLVLRTAILLLANILHRYSVMLNG